MELKKPIIEKVEVNGISMVQCKCPVCGRLIFKGHDESCAKCGQSIDWESDTQEIKIYTYYATFYDERVVGVVKARNLLEAEEFLRKTYRDYDEWKRKTLEEVKFNKNNICELYYGG